MNNFILVLLFLFGFNYVNNHQTKATNKNSVKIEEPKANEVINITDELYNLQIRIETTQNNKHNLVITMELHNGSHFISPNAKRDFKGKFNVDLGSYDDLTFNGNIIEIPRSVEEFDEHPFTNGLVNWVHVKTTYKQPLYIKSEDNFEVFGRVRFTIEPRCTLEEIPFAISYKNGVMKIIPPKC